MYWQSIWPKGTGSFIVSSGCRVVFLLKNPSTPVNRRHEFYLKKKKGRGANHFLIVEPWIPRLLEVVETWLPSTILLPNYTHTCLTVHITHTHVTHIHTHIRGQTHDHVQTLNLQVKRNEIKFSNRSQRSSQQETIIPESADISLYLPLNLTFLLLNYLIKSLEGSSVLQSHSIPADSQQDGGEDASPLAEGLHLTSMPGTSPLLN